MASIDPALVGVLVWTALALVAGVLLRRSPAALLTWAGVGWGCYLLVGNPYAGITVLLLLGMWVVHRYGLRHLLLYGGLAFVFATITWVDVAAGMLLPAAFADAAARTARFVAFAAAAYVLWRLATQRVNYLTNPLAWNAETRRVQQNAEYRRAKGLGKRGAGWAGRRARQAITGRPPPAPPRPPDDVDQLSQRDLFLHARRAGIKPAQHTTAELRDLVRAVRQQPPEPATARPHPPGPPPPTAQARPRTAPRNADGINRPRGAPSPTVLDVPPEVYEPGDLGMPAPLFHWRAPWWRVRP
jgi:hypothetical protein